MMNAELGKNLFIAGLAILFFVVTGIICIAVYWRMKRRKNNEPAVSYDHKLQQLEVGMHSDEHDAFDEDHNSERDDSIDSFELEESTYQEQIEMKATTEGIKLNVYSCSFKSCRLLLTRSTQPGNRSQIGVFNQGKVIKKGTQFGPIVENDMIKFEEFAYNSSHKELEHGNNWLYFVKIAGQDTSTNMDVIITDDGEIFYETRKDVPKGHELLSDWGWTAIDGEE